MGPPHPPVPRGNSSSPPLSLAPLSPHSVQQASLRYPPEPLKQIPARVMDNPGRPRIRACFLTFFSYLDIFLFPLPSYSHLTFCFVFAFEIRKCFYILF
ncbi:hypothetical protein BDZ91DRAFT_752477, partial [Kalaharituber pfeilii]